MAVEVAAVDAFGPAERAGLRRGDFISAVNGEQIKSIEDLNQSFRNRTMPLSPV